MGSRMATHSTWCVIRLLSTVYSERHGGSIHLRAATPAADGFPGITLVLRTTRRFTTLAHRTDSSPPRP